MYNAYGTYPYPYFINVPMYNNRYPYPYFVNPSMYNSNFSDEYIPFDDTIEYDSAVDFSRSMMDDNFIQLKDYGPEPFVVNIEEATTQNNNYRTALWTGEHLQVTLMSIDVGDDIGLEVHPTVDQFLRIEEGEGLVQMGDSENNLSYEKQAYDDFAIMVPAGKWHNVTNTGNTPLKLYAIYAPPEHERGTIHETKAIAEAAERNYKY